MVCGCPIFFFQRIPSDTNSLLQRVLHSTGYASGSRGWKPLLCNYVYVPSRIRVRPRILRCFVRSYYFSIKGRSFVMQYLKFWYKIFVQLRLQIDYLERFHKCELFIFFDIFYFSDIYTYNIFIRQKFYYLTKVIF